MSEDYEKYKSALLEWRGRNYHVVDYIMGKAELDGDLTFDEFLRLCAIAEGED